MNFSIILIRFGFGFLKEEFNFFDFEIFKINFTELTICILIGMSMFNTYIQSVNYINLFHKYVKIIVQNFKFIY